MHHRRHRIEYFSLVVYPSHPLESARDHTLQHARHLSHQIQVPLSQSFGESPKGRRFFVFSYQMTKEKKSKQKTRCSFVWISFWGLGARHDKPATCDFTQLDSILGPFLQPVFWVGKRGLETWFHPQLFRKNSPPSLAPTAWGAKPNLGILGISSKLMLNQK